MSMKAICWNETSDAKFLQSIEEKIADDGTTQMKSAEVRDFIQEVFTLAVVRGLNEKEFSILLKLFTKECIGTLNKIKLLAYMVPSSIAPSEPMTHFLSWFISSYRNELSRKLSVAILQWITGLLDNDLVDPNIVNIFYFDFFAMLLFSQLRKFACKLLCNLTKPQDVTLSWIKFVNKVIPKKGLDETYFLALLNVFKAFKPWLVPIGVTTVNIDEVLKKVPQNMDTIMRVVKRKQQQQLQYKLIESGLFEFRDSVYRLPETINCTTTTLIPFPDYHLEGLHRLIVCYPNSIVEAFERFKRVPIPKYVMSLLRSEVGFFLIMYKGKEIQMQLSISLFSTLQRVFIDQDEAASDSDKEYLLSQVYKLQCFMKQGIPCVSLFLSGYLIKWDSLDHRPHILNLIEWSTFDSFQELSANILRPLYMIFVSSDEMMKQQIIQTATNLLRNMYVSCVGRSLKELPYPFLKTGPKWATTQEEVQEMLEHLVNFVRRLVTLCFVLHPVDSLLLLESIRFYKRINQLEMQYNMQMWTVVPRGVVYHSVLNVAPLALNNVCRLLLRYHTIYLPHLRQEQPNFYRSCAEKISLVSKYVQELLNLLWNEQAMSRKEDGVLMKAIPEEEFERIKDNIDVDLSFDICHSINFMPFFMQELKIHGPDFLKSKNDYLAVVEFYLPDVSAFIKYFSPSFQDSAIV